MSSPINAAFDLTGTGSIEIPMNRWTRSVYTLQIDAGGTGLSITGTLDELLRLDEQGQPISANYYPLVQQDGTSLSIITAPGLYTIGFYALTAIRVTAVTGGSGRIMQQGEAS